MSMVGVGRLIMDDLIFHELWLSKNKFKDYENKNEMESDSSDDEDSNDMKELFKKEKEKAKAKSKAIAPNSATEWFAIILGVFFVAALAGVASYQAYRADFSSELSKSEVKIINLEDQPDVLNDQVNDQTPDPVSLKIYNEIFLPQDLIPIDYTLYYDLDIKQNKSKGLVKIELHCNSSTNRIILHSITTTNHIVEVHDSAGKKQEIQPKSIKYNKYRQMMIIQLKSNLTAGSTYSLFIAFKKKLTFGNNEGIYMSHFLDGDGKKNIMISTDFEPYQARKAFPCFDEPIYKATFTIIVQHDKDGLNSNSNMPLLRKEEIGKDRVECHFKKTRPMCTYLVGWQVSSLQYREAMVRENLPVRVYAPKGRLDETERAKYIAPRCVKFYEDLFKIKYMLPKLDLIPVTSFISLADEVWGMILFLEHALLFDSKTGSSSSLEVVTTTVCHEIAHQWFGDLVSVKSWEDLWLKESFATYLQTLPVKKYYPSWKVSELNYRQNEYVGMKADSSIYTHPVLTKEKDPFKLRATYDAVTYQKGASLLVMLEHFLGHDVFFAGVHHYLEKYKYKNAATNQFWQAISEALPKYDVEEIMENWVNKPGYPVILFKNVDDKIQVRQDRFVFQNSSITGITKPDTTIWQVPITIKYSNSKNISKILLTKKEDVIDVNPKDIEWIKVNYGGTGFYRVYYSKENWKALLNVLNTKHTTLRAIDRASLLSDISEFARYKYVSLFSALEFTPYLKKERDFTAWLVGDDIIAYTQGLFYNTPLKKCFNAYYDDLISPAIKELNSKTKHTHDENNLISLLLNIAVAIDKRPLVDELNRMFLAWIVRDGQVHIPTTAMQASFNAGIKMGQSYEWNTLLSIFKTVDGAKQQMCLAALSNSKDEKLLKRLIDYTFDGSTIPFGLVPRVFEYVCSNPVGRNVAWSALRKNYKMLIKRYSGSERLFWFGITSCLSSGKTVTDLKEAEEFMKTEHLQDNIQMKKIIESIKYRIELVKEYSSVEKWLKKHVTGCKT